MTIINVCNLFAPIVGPLIGIINILILILILILYQRLILIKKTAWRGVLCEWRLEQGKKIVNNHLNKLDDKLTPCLVLES